MSTVLTWHIDPQTRADQQWLSVFQPCLKIIYHLLLSRDPESIAVGAIQNDRKILWPEELTLLGKMGFCHSSSCIKHGHTVLLISLTQVYITSQHPTYMFLNLSPDLKPQDHSLTYKLMSYTLHEVLMQTKISEKHVAQETGWDSACCLTVSLTLTMYMFCCWDCGRQ